MKIEDARRGLDPAVEGEFGAGFKVRSSQSVDGPAARLYKALRCADFLRAFAAVDKEEDGHADSQAVGDLVKNDGAAAVGDVAVNLDAAVDGAGVHDEGIGLGAGEPGFVEAEEAGVFAEAGKHGLALAFVLDAEEVDDVG